jgi:hypothetical protein
MLCIVSGAKRRIRAVTGLTGSCKGRPANTDGVRMCDRCQPVSFNGFGKLILAGSSLVATG